MTTTTTTMLITGIIKALSTLATIVASVDRALVIHSL